MRRQGRFAGFSERLMMRVALLVGVGAVAGSIVAPVHGPIAFAPALDGSGAEASVIVTLFDADGDGLDDATADRPATTPAEMRRERRAISLRQREILMAADIDPDRAELYWVGGVLTVDATPEEIEALESLPSVEAVEPEPQVTISSVTPDISPVLGGNWGVGAVRADDVWEQSGLDGSGVLVGHIDTGADPDNPSLQGKIVGWKDFVSGQPNPYDDNGHGTHTASTAAGRAVDGEPIGVAPGANLIVAKAIGSSGAAPGGQLLAAAQWLADPDGDPATKDYPAVINCSWTAADPNDPWFRAVVRQWRAQGIVPVFAAGNTGPSAGTVGSPASYPEVITVGAIDQSSTVASFSSRGPFAWTNLDGNGPDAGTSILKPDLVAPGVNVNAAYLDGFISYDGSSMAAPHVTGIIAIMKQAVPTLSPDDAANALNAGVTDLGAAGPDFDYGNGMVDAHASLTALGVSLTSFADVRIVAHPPRRTNSYRLGYQVALTNAQSYRFRVDGGPWSVPTSSPKFAVSPTEGHHSIQVQAIGNEGARDIAPDVHKVTIDRTGPRSTMSWSVRGRTVAFRTAVDDLVGVDANKIVWRIGSATLRGRRVVYTYPGPSPKRVTLIATDRLGNRRVLRRLVTPRRPTVARVAVPTRARSDGMLRVRGRAIRPGAVQVTVTPTTRLLKAAPSTASIAPRRRARRIAKGTFRVAVPLRNLAPGTYRVTITPRGVLGRGERTLTRTVRVF